MPSHCYSSRADGGWWSRLRIFPRWALLAGATIACSEEPTGTLADAPDGPASSATITYNVVNPESLAVAVGGGVEASCQPMDSERNALTNRNCNWSTRDSAVATVTGSGTRTGTITGHQAGATWVIASAMHKKDSVWVAVGSGAPDGTASSSTITYNVVNPESLTVAVGGTSTAGCQPLDSERNPLTNRNCNWSTRDSAVATVTGSGTRTGTITGHKAGATWVIASATYKRDSVRVTVGGTTSEPPPSPPPPPGGSAVIVAAGDIASCSSSGDEATARLIDGLPNATVVTLGDNVYDDGTTSEFRDCYEPSWGRHKGRTRPSPGNHEYHTSGASGYYAYFGAAAGPAGRGYYSYDLGAWHLVSLNSNTSMSSSSAQMQWLKADLAANAKQCILAYWHHPRFSSAKHGNASSTEPLWQALYEAGADVVLSSHDHSYERYAPQTASGAAATKGIRQFVVGTGGRSHYPLASRKANSEVFDATSYGVLKLTLGASSYAWEFIPVPGQSFTDTGTGSCGGGGTTPPPPSTPPTLASVHVTPASATVNTGTTRQFQAYGQTSTGDSVGVTATWTATGGTIGTAALYTAGSTAGSYRVVASASGKADTSEVIVTATPPPPGPPPSGPPPVASRACPSSGYTRLVNVSTASQLSSALNNAQPGDQVRLAAGTYPGTFSWDNSGTATNPIVVCGATPRTALLTGMWISGGSYVTIIGLVWQGPVGDENLVRIVGADHVSFIGNEIRGGGGNAGLITQDVHHVTIAYNYIHDNGVDVQRDHGIYFQRTTGIGNVVANNLLVNNAARGLSIHDNSGTNANDILVAHNTIVGNGSTGLLVNDGDRVVVVNNISAFNGEDRDQPQIRVLHGNSNQVRNNLTWSPSSSLQGIENATSSVMSGNRIGNPLLVSQFGDLRLQAGSPAIGLGLTQYVQGADYNQKQRDGSPDAGAYEQ